MPHLPTRWLVRRLGAPPVITDATAARGSSRSSAPHRTGSGAAAATARRSSRSSAPHPAGSGAARGGGRARALLAAVVLVAAAVTGSVFVATSARAATGCQVAYAVTNQWQGGFGASVTLTNLGDPLNGWTLTWSFTAGQSVTQYWNAAIGQSGARVSAADTGYNAAVPTGGTASFGFNGSWNNVANPVPTDFAVNGVSCTGATGPTSTAPTSASPTARASVTPSATGSATPGVPTTPPASYPNPGRVTGSTGAHDPSVVRTPGGLYTVVSTGNNIPIKTSTDRINWVDAGVVWPSGASWTTGYTGGSASLWAPDISYHNGTYYLYYVASTFGSQHSGIFLATSPTGAAGSWTNQGLVIESSASVNYNAIDPNLFVDPSGQWWLDFGSFWTGIKMIRLDPATGKRLSTDTTVRALSQRTTANGAVEAPFIYRHGGYYYLFVSFDLCCQGASSTYRVMVGRSTALTGPYVDRAGTAMTSGGGTQLLAGHGSIHGPGHEAVISDNGQDVLFYHYYADSGASYLGINLLGWDSAGWPFVY
jgi:arabinan endo-1,5-alpha-L-arabinosidase